MGADAADAARSLAIERAQRESIPAVIRQGARSWPAVAVPTAMD